MAEMILRHLVNEHLAHGATFADGSSFADSDILIDSCATSTEEIGNDIYPPARRCLSAHGIPYTRHAARQITRHDYDIYDDIYCMDANNLRNIRRQLGDDYADRTTLLMSLVGTPRDVADPWYTGDFEATYRDVLAACQHILATLTSYDY